ncbi:DUF1211 domain-containing protein, partial [Candidatus Saccharibacteria bacterium]|nr:DUF1211 domain-containing protein [Candidatus Saccharibacteria bacterium]
MADRNHIKKRFTAGLYSTRRMEALTDGVFAIAMTLLILDLDVTKFGQVLNNQQLVHIFSNDFSTTFISFLISFLLLGSMWAVHARQFDSIKYTDRTLMMINNLRLLTVVLIPFTTSLSGAYPDLLLAKILFPINFLLLSIASSVEWNYATSKEVFYDTSKLSKIHISNVNKMNYIFVGVATFVAVASA